MKLAGTNLDGEMIFAVTTSPTCGTIPAISSAAEDNMKGCVLLVRHGGKEHHAWDTRATAEVALGLSDTGKRETEEVAVALADELLLPTGGIAIEVSEIWYSNSEHSRQTATILQEVLPSARASHRQELDPRDFWRGDHREQVSNLVGSIVSSLNGHSTTSVDLPKPQGKLPAILVVGHEPQLAWIADKLLGGLVPANVPIFGSEVVCIGSAGRQRPRIYWVLSPSPAAGTTQPSAADLLREKIKSKMETAKLLGGVALAGLGWLIASFLEPKKLEGLPRGALISASVSITFFFLSLGLFLMTMYSYDRLLMPKRFWGSGRAGTKRPSWLVARPPSSEAWVLYQNMMHVWWWQFTTATVSAVVGLVLLAYSAARNSQMLNPIQHLHRSATIVVSFFAVLAVLYRLGRPRLGVQD